MSKNNYTSILNLLYFSLMLSSCTFQKRTYNKGFSIQLRSIESFTLNKRSPSIEKKLVQLPKLESKVNFEKEIESIALKNNGKQKNSLLKDTIQPCDLIILITGEKIEAYLIEINEQEIKYVKCNNPQGPFYFKSLTNLHKIIYPNGTSDYFNRLNQNVKIENIHNSPLSSEELEKKKEEEQRINNRKIYTFTIILLVLPALLAAISYLFNI
jgi:hypothetical protein